MLTWKKCINILKARQFCNLHWHNAIFDHWTTLKYLRDLAATVSGDWSIESALWRKVLSKSCKENSQHQKIFLFHFCSSLQWVFYFRWNRDFYKYSWMNNNTIKFILISKHQLDFKYFTMQNGFTSNNLTHGVKSSLFRQIPIIKNFSINWTLKTLDLHAY